MSGRTRYLELAALLGPFAVVAGLRLLTGAGLAHAPAAPVVTPVQPPERAAPARVLTPAQERASAWVASLEGSATIESPMESRVEPKPPGPPAPEPARAVARPFRLSAVMGGDGGAAMAMINGRVYRINDEVAPGCRLLSIDVRACTADVRLADGTVLVVERER